MTPDTHVWLGTYCVLLSSWVIPCLFFECLGRTKWSRQFLLQPKKTPTPALKRKALLMAGAGLAVVPAAVCGCCTSLWFDPVFQSILPSNKLALDTIRSLGRLPFIANVVSTAFGGRRRRRCLLFRVTSGRLLPDRRLLLLRLPSCTPRGSPRIHR